MTTSSRRIGPRTSSRPSRRCSCAPASSSPIPVPVDHPARGRVRGQGRGRRRSAPRLERRVDGVDARVGGPSAWSTASRRSTSVNAVVSAWMPAFYDPADGQIYRTASGTASASSTAALRDALAAALVHQLAGVAPAPVADPNAPIAVVSPTDSLAQLAVDDFGAELVAGSDGDRPGPLGIRPAPRADGPSPDRHRRPRRSDLGVARWGRRPRRRDHRLRRRRHGRAGRAVDGGARPVVDRRRHGRTASRRASAATSGTRCWRRTCRPRPRRTPPTRSVLTCTSRPSAVRSNASTARSPRPAQRCSACCRSRPSPGPSWPRRRPAPRRRRSPTA